jgi:hypothetical protein
MNTVQSLAWVILVGGVGTLVVSLARRSEAAPPGGGSGFAYISPIRQTQYDTDPGQTWNRKYLHLEVDVRNEGNVAKLCVAMPQMACAEGDWLWQDLSINVVSSGTIDPGKVFTFQGDVLDSPYYGYSCRVRFIGDPGEILATAV